MTNVAFCRNDEYALAARQLVLQAAVQSFPACTELRRFATVCCDPSWGSQHVRKPVRATALSRYKHVIAGANVHALALKHRKLTSA